jgi:hypothetical protein
MATEKITGFDIKSFESIDPRTVVTNSAARLLLDYPYVGMRVQDLDTGETYKYKGTPPSNVAGDWDRIPDFLFGTGAPDNSLAAINDYYIDTANNYFYQKTGASAWTLRTDFTGVQAFTGAAAPLDANGVDGDLYFQHNGDVYKKSGGTWGSILFNIAGAAGSNGDLYSTTSSTSVAIPTSHPTSVSLTVDTGLAYSIGQSVVAAETATTFFTGTVTGYVTGTGVLDIDSVANTGTGTPTAWTVNLNTAAGQEGATGKPGIPDQTYTGGGGTYPNSLTFDETEVTAVEADVAWTVDNPYIAYVLTDSRSNINAPAGVEGTQAGNIIIWDGSVWDSKGRIRGFDGAAGDTGWSPVISTEEVNTTTTVLKITGWEGGTGGLPASLSAIVSSTPYISNGGLVATAGLATNIRGPQGSQGNDGDVTSVTTRFNQGSYRFNPGSSITTGSQPIVQSFSFVGPPLGPGGTAFTMGRSNAISAIQFEEMYLSGRVGTQVYFAGNNNSGIYSTVNLSLVISKDGTFSTSTFHGRYTLAVNIYRIFNYTSQPIDVETAWKFPASGTWYMRMEATIQDNPVQFCSTSGLYYKALSLNKG